MSQWRRITDSDGEYFRRDYDGFYALIQWDADGAWFYGIYLGEDDSTEMYSYVEGTFEYAVKTVEGWVKRNYNKLKAEADMHDVYKELTNGS